MRLRTAGNAGLLYEFLYLVFVFFLQEDFISNMFDRPGERLACDAYMCFVTLASYLRTLVDDWLEETILVLTHSVFTHSHFSS